jgi:hypothetical protein
MNALRDATRSRLIESGLPFLRQLRTSPTVAELLEGEKTDTETWADFALLGMITLASMRRMVRADLRGVIRLGVGIVGAVADGVMGERAAETIRPTSVGPADNCRKPPTKAVAR